MSSQIFRASFDKELERALKRSGLKAAEAARYMHTDYYTVYRWLKGLQTPRKHHQRLILLALEHYRLMHKETGNGKEKGSKGKRRR